MTTKPIDCALHDHLELACLYGYELMISCRDGTVVSGRAMTTETRRDKREVLRLTSSGALVDVLMADIATVSVTTPGARFVKLEF